jgi:hypothetical protein
MRDLILNAGIEAKICQKDFTELIYKRQVTVSDIKNGKGEVDSSTLALLAHVFNKPFGNPYPSFLYKEIIHESLTPLRMNLLYNLGRFGMIP